MFGFPKEPSMSNSILNHTQGIRRFDFIRWRHEDGILIAEITRQPNEFECARCCSMKVTPTFISTKRVQGLPMGSKRFYAEVRMHRLRCHDCGAYQREMLPFTFSDRGRITRRLASALVELRREMSLSAVAKHYGVPLQLVKRLELSHLETKYRHIPLADVRMIGIDEIHVGRNHYKTIVRDLGSGRVLHVGDGRDGAALDKFGQRLRRSKAKIEAVAVDMAVGFTAWLKEHLKEAKIVYDPFHLVKQMNDRVNAVRKRCATSLDKEEASLLKKSGSCC